MVDGAGDLAGRHFGLPAGGDVRGGMAAHAQIVEGGGRHIVPAGLGTQQHKAADPAAGHGIVIDAQGQGITEKEERFRGGTGSHDAS